MSLGLRLGLALTGVFGLTAVLLLPWIDRTSAAAAEETLQQVNRGVAEAVVKHAELFDDGEVVEKEIQGVFMKLMAVHPSLELYLLDDAGRILAYDAPEDVVQLEQVDLAAAEIAAGDVRIDATQTVQQGRPFGLLSRIRELQLEQ